MLPTSGFEVGPVPRQADQVGEETLGQPVLADHALGLGPALGREGEGPARRFDVPLLAEAADHLGDGGGAIAESIGQTGLDDRRPLLLELVHGLEVLLDRGMEAVGHLHNPAAVITKSVAKPASTPSSRPHISSSRKPIFWATHRSWTTT